MSPEVILTFDNLGEAADEELGVPFDPPPHHSVSDVLPRVLPLLADAGLRATFFVEAINVERYPSALRSIVDAGHEVGCHAWRHEAWHTREPSDRVAILRRSMTALRSLGIQAEGFRPPGGLLEDADFAILAAEGISWASPAGSRAGVREGVACLPFAWRDIDAYFYAPALAPLRRGDGRTAAPLDPAEFARSATDAVERAVRAPGEPVSLVVHPFLYTTPERFSVLEELLGDLGRLRRAGTANIGPGRDAAARLRDRPAPHVPLLDDSTWSSPG